MPKIGAHVSAAVSLETSFIKAKEIGASCMQIFVSPPRQWGFTEHNDEEVKRFKDAQKESGIGPNFIHGTYLINLGTPHEEHLLKSIEWLKYGLKQADNLEMDGVIFHLGSHKGLGHEVVLKQVVEALKKALEGSKALLLLETTAGSGNVLGGSFREMGEIIRGVANDRLRICMDTQHVFASGYNVKSPIGLRDVLKEFDEEIGLEKLAAIHANDSKTAIGSHVDRHENIGDGLIGQEGFANLINNPLLKDVPFILEVPGFGGGGPDKENVEILKGLIKD